ncbi:hypothetical protein C8R43DRAFT_1133988 [Mycena crocata]|nr:hypothetical protein C8R43DRAFT_1133988 [Mycena crocata]
MPKVSKSPVKSRPSPQSSKSPRKKVTSAKFVDDEALESDGDGVLVDIDNAPAVSQDPGDQYGKSNELDSLAKSLIRNS